MKHLSLATFIWCLCFVTAAEPIALRHAHAHNDYEHPHPLMDALAAGFTSVEADVYWIDGEIRVAHNRADAKPGRTLRTLYLEPLRNIIRTNNNRVHPRRTEFFLMIDYKASGENEVGELHHAVTNELASYTNILTRVQGSKVTLGPVMVVLSGSRPASVIARESERWWAIDGQLPDLTNGVPAHLVPWISTSWRPTFKWDGQETFPSEERAKLRQLLAQAHAQGRRLRFWGAPDRLEFWRALREDGVDLINTDQLEKLAAYLATTRDP